MRKPTDLKRVQIITRNDGRKFLQVECFRHMLSVADLCQEQGTMMLNRLVLRRLSNPRPYKLGRPIDVLCMMIRSYTLGYKECQPGGLGSDREVRITSHAVAGMINAFSENIDLTDAVMGDIVMHYIGRYSSLFNTFYGDQLRAQGVEEES